MNRSEKERSRRLLFGKKMLKGLFLYVFVPCLLLTYLASPIGNAVRRSASAAYLIILAASGAVGLNWLVYSVIHRKRPSLLVFAHGVFCLTVVVIIECEALPGYDALASTLSLIAGSFALLFLFLLSFWLASYRSRPAHVAAVGCWIIIGLAGCFMVYRVIRDIESRNVSGDTWITVGFIAALLLGANGPRIRTALRRAAFRRRASGLAAGRIVQIIGETFLDLDGDPVTPYYALIRYSVDDVPYEARADISRSITRRYGKKAFIGRVVLVCYVPGNPAEAFVKRIDRHILDQPSDDT